MTHTDECSVDFPVAIETTEDMAQRERGDIVEAGETALYVVDSVSRFVGPDSVRAVSEDGRTGELATGVLNSTSDIGGVMWADEIDSDDPPEREDLMAEYGDIHVVGSDVEAIPELLPDSVGDRNCPTCGDSPGGGVFLYKTVDGETIHEVYRCKQNTDDDSEDCNEVYAHSHAFPDADDAVVHFHARDGTEYATSIRGVFEKRETSDWNSGMVAVLNESDAAKGVVTASEVAAFINAKMDTSGEAQRFGVAELGGGVGKYEARQRPSAPTWWDDADGWEWVAKVQFVPVDSPDDLSTGDE